MIRSIALAVALYLIPQAVYSTQVTIEWPEGTDGTYGMSAGMQKPTNQSGSYEVPEATNIRLVGTGFDHTFKIEKGKIKVLYPLPKEAVRYDNNTFPNDQCRNQCH